MRQQNLDMLCTDNYLQEKIRHVIKAVFKSTPPQRFLWTEKTIAPVQELVPATHLPFRDRTIEVQFQEEAKAILASKIPDAIFNVIDDSAGYTWGHACALEAYDPSTQITYVLLYCGYYPIATLRPCTYPGYGEGMDHEWNFKLSDKAILNQMNINLKELETSFEYLFASYNYCFKKSEAELFQHRIRINPFRSYEIWDFLFYIGIGYG